MKEDIAHLLYFDKEKSHLSALQKVQFEESTTRASSVQTIPGIGKKSKEHLEKQHIKTIDDLLNEIQDKYPILYEEWMVNENCSVPQAETVEQVIQRIEHFIQYVLGKDYNTILAVTHSGFLYALYKFITDSPMDLKPNEMDISFPNGCIVQLNVEIKMDKIQLELEINNRKYHKNIYH